MFLKVWFYNRVVCVWSERGSRRADGVQVSGCIDYTSKFVNIPYYFIFLV